MKKLSKKTAISLLLLATVIVAAGCGASETLMEQVTGVEVEQDGESVTVSTDEGEVTIGGESSELPEDFPFALFPDAKIESSMVTGQQGEKSYIVSLSSDKEIEELTTFYEEALKEKGITPEKMEIKDETTNTVMLNGEIDKLNVSVQIYHGDSVDVKGNVVNLIVNVKE